MSNTIKEFPYSPEQLAWLHDLETTSATQGIGYLHKDDAFCCLGRACVTLGIPAELGRYAREGIVTYGNQESILPYKAMYKLRLRDDTGTFEHRVILDNRMAYSLVGLNDAHNYTFKQIAAYIQSDPTNVFTNLDAPEVSP